MVEFSRRSTAADIAKSAGVAKSTVSLAFSAPERVSTKTRDRILSAAKAAGYTPNPVAQSLKTGRNNIVGLILADLTNPHGGSVLEQVQKTANEIGYMVMTATAAHDPKRDIEFVRKFEQLNVRAAIIMPSGSDEKYVSALKDSSIRFVTYGHKLSGLECDHVGLDNRMGMELLVRHLVELGHRRIGHIAGNQRQWSGTERFDGLRQSLKNAGLTLDESDLGFGEYYEDISYRAALELLRKSDRPTALVTANNVTAIGRCVPQEIFRFVARKTSPLRRLTKFRGVNSYHLNLPVPCNRLEIWQSLLRPGLLNDLKVRVKIYLPVAQSLHHILWWAVQPGL